MSEPITIKDPRSSEPAIPGFLKLVFCAMLGVMLHKGCFEQQDNQRIAKAVITEMRATGVCVVQHP